MNVNDIKYCKPAINVIKAFIGERSTYLSVSFSFKKSSNVIQCNKNLISGL